MNTFKPYRRTFWASLLLVVMAFTVSAQEFRGSLSGKILDPQGAVVPGSKVDLKNIETGVVVSATTDTDGSYSFALVQPGKYTLTITKDGFNTAVRDGIQVRVADKLTLDVQLEIGVTAMVTTVASALALETGIVNTGTVVTGQQISELPLTEGTAYQLATLAPGIAYAGNPLFTGPTSNGNLAAFRSNGGTGANQITLDGSPNYAFDGGVGFSPPSDAVQEFKVQTNTFDAQHGYSAGATVNVAVKTGTNDVHGSGWYFNRDGSRTANNFFGNRSKQSRPERTYHRFGGVLNGPVYLPGMYNGQDKTFFLVSYERLKDNIAEPQIFTVPTEAMRRGDFSSLIVNRNNINDPANVVIFNPFSGVQSGNNVVRSSFGCPTSGAVAANSTCNKIPTNLLNPVAANLVKYYPLPNINGVAAGTQNNFFSNQLRHQDYRAWLTRIDHRISSNQSIFGKYYHSFNPEDRQDWAGIVNGFPITQGFEYRTNDGGSVDYTNAMTPNIVFDIRSSLNRFVQERRPAQSFMIETPQQIGFAGTTPFVPTNNNGLTFVATLTNPFPAGLSGVQPSFGSSLGLLTGLGADVAASDLPIIGLKRKNAKFARIVLGIQRELPGQMVVEANYIQAYGYNLAVSKNLDFVPRQFLGETPATDAASNTFLSVTIPNPFRNLVPGGSPLNTAGTITRAQSLLAYPQFNNLWVQEYNGSNRYKSLQLQVNKRFTNDMSLTATYTSRTSKSTRMVQTMMAVILNRVPMC